jgi:hypothetical protein
MGGTRLALWIVVALLAGYLIWVHFIFVGN